MKKYILLILLVSLNFTSFSQIPIKQIEQRIMQLNADVEISGYWDMLESEDQYTLLPIEDDLTYDSMALNNMIQTCFMVKHHGVRGVNLRNFSVPILNLAHNQIPEASFVFWPIIEQCREFGGLIETFGGEYPAYELECISLNYYNYSMLFQKPRYDGLMKKLAGQDIDLIVAKLCAIHQENKKLYQLKTQKILGEWDNQPFINRKEEGCFEFVQMENKEIYLKKRDRLQKLVVLKKSKGIVFYRIDKEPFGWYYSLSEQGDLLLLNEKDEVLIEYDTCL